MLRIPTMFYVVSRALACQMRGERVASKRGTMFGVFASRPAAEAYVAERKLGLATEIVEQ